MVISYLLQVVPGCYAYRFLVDGEWKNAVGAEMAKDYEGELVSLLIVEEEEVEEKEKVEKEQEEEVKEKGDGGCVEKAEKFDFEQKDKGEKLVDRDHRRGVGAC